MTPEERERMNWLCKEIQTEKDPDRFSKLVHEVDALFEEKERRFDLKQNDQQQAAPAQDD